MRQALQNTNPFLNFRGKTVTELEELIGEKEIDIKKVMKITVCFTKVEVLCQRRQEVEKLHEETEMLKREMASSPPESEEYKTHQLESKCRNFCL